MTAQPHTPYIHEIRVTWGDCDPAKIAYTGRLPWFALDAINGWWEENFGGDGFFQLEMDRNVGTPFVHLSMDFKSPITPRHRLLCHTWPAKLGEKSITFRVEGVQNDVLCFSGTFVCVFVVADSFKSRVAPEEFRDVITPMIRPL